MIDLSIVLFVFIMVVFYIYYQEAARNKVMVEEKLSNLESKWKRPY